MANWKRIEKLRDHLRVMKETKYKKFNMGTYISSLTGQYNVTVKQLRENGAACGSAVCLAGEAIIQFAPLRSAARLYGLDTTLDGRSCFDVGRELLRLTYDEAAYMFSGSWNRGKGTIRGRATKARAVRYLTKVLNERDVMVEV